MYNLLLCIVKISPFGVLTTIKESAFLVLDASSYKNLSNRKVP